MGDACRMVDCRERAKSEARGTGKAGSVASMSPGSRREAPYSRSEAEQAEPSRTDVRMPRSTKGKCSIQLEELVAQARDISRFFNVRC